MVHLPFLKTGAAFVAETSFGDELVDDENSFCGEIRCPFCKPSGDGFIRNSRFHISAKFGIGNVEKPANTAVQAGSIAFTQYVILGKGSCLGEANFINHAGEVIQTSKLDGGKAERCGGHDIDWGGKEDFTSGSRRQPKRRVTEFRASG